MCNILTIIRFGPLINHWTTRFEAKHKYFKHLANIMGNFTNICYSLALRHQLYQCYIGLNSNTLCSEDITIGPGIIIWTNHSNKAFSTFYLLIGSAVTVVSHKLWNKVEVFPATSLFRFVSCVSCTCKDAVEV